MEPSHGMITVAPPVFASLAGEDKEGVVLPHAKREGEVAGCKAKRRGLTVGASAGPAVSYPSPGTGNLRHISTDSAWILSVSAVSVGFFRT